MQSALLVCAASLLYVICVGLWRVLFHPLSRFPGPKLAAATSLYRTYHEVIRGGEFLRKLNELHAIYGAVVRVGPNELHFNDPRAYNDIYSFKHRYEKEPSFYKCFGVDRSTFGTIDPHEAKERRSMLGSLFSRRSALAAEDMIQEHVQKLIDKLELDGGPCDLFLGFRCATLDMITSFCFGKDIGALKSDGFAFPLLLTIQASIPFLFLIKSFPWLPRILTFCPHCVSSHLPFHLDSQVAVRQQVKELLNIAPETSEMVGDTHIVTVYHRLLFKKRFPTRFAAEQLLLEEALSLLQAGSDTVGNTCTVGTFHVLHNPTIREKLVEELIAVSPDARTPIKLSVLQNLPYLTAVIKESLRLSHGFVSPLPRLVNRSDQFIGGLQIPCGTVVGMSVTALHNNRDVFHHPQVFEPERWLQHDSKSLERFLAPFSKGPRMCLGVNLAWMELYLILGNIFRQLDIELVGSNVEEFNNFKDYFIPVHQGRHLHVKNVKRPGPPQ